MSEYPECDKILAAKEKSQIIGEFIEEFLHNKGIVLAKVHNHSDICYEETNGMPVCGFQTGDLTAVHFSINDLLAEFFGIDNDKAERERRKILENIRNEK
jgi:hypothetical protein